MARWRVRGHLGLPPVEVRHEYVADAPQVALAQDGDRVRTLPPDAAEEPLAGGVLSRCPIGGPQLGDAAPHRDPGEGRAILAVIIADQGARALVERVASRSRRATRASVGRRVTPTGTTRREPSAMTQEAYTGRRGGR